MCLRSSTFPAVIAALVVTMQTCIYTSIYTCMHKHVYVGYTELYCPYTELTMCFCLSASAAYDSPGSVLISPVPHQMMSYMNMGSLSRTELQLLNQLHCRRKRRHRTIFTDEQLEALEGLFQETKYPDVGTREQLARKVHLREEKVEVRGCFFSFFLKVIPLILFPDLNEAGNKWISSETKRVFTFKIP